MKKNEEKMKNGKKHFCFLLRRSQWCSWGRCDGNFCSPGGSCDFWSVMVSPNSCFLFFRIFQNFSKNFRFWLGGAAPQTPRILAGGASPPQTPPLTGLAGGLPPPGPPAFFFFASDDTFTWDLTLKKTFSQKAERDTQTFTKCLVSDRTSRKFQI